MDITGADKNSKGLKKGDMTGCISVLLFALFIVFVASASTSPLYGKYTDYESAFMTLMGRGIKTGSVMYRDYFDVRGPLVFLWEALGQLICDGRFGIFALQCLGQMAVCYFIYRICCLYDIGAWQSVAILFTYGYSFFSLAGGGNSAEEFCLPFCLASLYCALRLIGREPKDRRLYSVLGLCTAVCLFSVLQAAFWELMLFAAVFIFVLKRDGIKVALRGMLFFLLPVLAVALLIICAHAMTGTLGQMIFWSFAMAFRFSMRGRLLLILLPPVILLAVGSFVCLKAKNKLSAAALLAVPIICLVLLSGNFRKTFDTDFGIVLNGVGESRYAQAVSALSFVPEAERGDILCLDPGTRFFEYCRLMPGGRYPYDTEAYFAIYPTSKEEVIRDIKSGRHKWLLYDLVEKSGDAELFEAIRDRYEVVTIQGIHLLARLKD